MLSEKIFESIHDHEEGVTAQIKDNKGVIRLRKSYIEQPMQWPNENG
jgi:hypothetical protein